MPSSPSSPLRSSYTPYPRARPPIGDGHRQAGWQRATDDARQRVRAPRVGSGCRKEPPCVRGVVRGHDPTIDDHRRPRVEGHLHLDATGDRAPGRIRHVAEPEAGAVTAGAKPLSVDFCRVPGDEERYSLTLAQSVSRDRLGPTGVEIRAPLAVVARLVPRGARQVVDPVAPIRHAVAIVVDDHAVCDPRLRWIHVRRPVRRGRETHRRSPTVRSRMSTQAGEHGSGIAQRIDVGRTASAGRWPLQRARGGSARASPAAGPPRSMPAGRSARSGRPAVRRSRSGWDPRWASG